MSKKDCSPDNSACEASWVILKQKCFMGINGGNIALKHLFKKQIAIYVGIAKIELNQHS